MGTPDFAVPPLLELIKHHQVVAVLTQPDRPSGRGHKLTPSPVKVAALEHGIKVLQPQSLTIKKVDDGNNHIAKEHRICLKEMDADIFVVAAYGLILPKAVLGIPTYGSINIHGSILPKYRGASPIHAALLNGDDKTGITIMDMDVGIDTGDMILKKEISILPGDRFMSLHDKLSTLGAECIIEAVDLIAKGNATRTPQNHNKSCYAPMIKKSDGLINWNDTSQVIINKLRALDMWPSIYFMYNGQQVKVRGLEICNDTKWEGSLPGTILTAASNDGLIIKTADNAVKITEIQPSGKKPMAIADYLRGAKVEVGLVL